MAEAPRSSWLGHVPGITPVTPLMAIGPRGVFLNTREFPSPGPRPVVLGGARFDGSTAGVPAATRLRAPADVALDGSGRIYVSDANSHRVVVFPPLLFLPETAAIADRGRATRSGRRQPQLNSQYGLATPRPGSSSGIFDRQNTLYRPTPATRGWLHFLKSAAMARRQSAGQRLRARLDGRHLRRGPFRPAGTERRAVSAASATGR
jgi:hypothetical protein